jgi:hypothetical protein
MFTDEPDRYLSSLKDFLVEQQSKLNDPTVLALIAEIDRELLKRTEHASEK